VAIFNKTEKTAGFFSQGIKQKAGKTIHLYKSGETDNV
jgi:hypothetical protein